jgi:hypothetical protein
MLWHDPHCLLRIDQNIDISGTGKDVFNLRLPVSGLDVEHQR